MEQNFNQDVRAVQVSRSYTVNEDGPTPTQRIRLRRISRLMTAHDLNPDSAQIYVELYQLLRAWNVRSHLLKDSFTV